jgi:hypothetical protein
VLRTSRPYNLSNLLHCRSPFYLCFEHVDNLGAYTASRRRPAFSSHLFTTEGVFLQSRLHNLFPRTHNPVHFVSRGEPPGCGVVSCPNACHTSEPVRIPTMYDGQLTPSRCGTSVRISFL